MNGRDVCARLQGELARLAPLGPWDTLAVPADSGPAQVRAAFLALTKLYHPNRFARETPETIEAANELFLLIRRAYGQLTEEASRRGLVSRANGASPIPAPAQKSGRAEAAPAPISRPVAPVPPAADRPSAQAPDAPASTRAPGTRPPASGSPPGTRPPGTRPPGTRPPGTRAELPPSGRAPQTRPPAEPPARAPDARPGAPPPAASTQPPAPAPPRGPAPPLPPARPAPARGTRPASPPFGPRVELRPPSRPAASPSVKVPPVPGSPTTGRSSVEVRAILEAAKQRPQRYEEACRLVARKQPREAREILLQLVAEDPQSRRYRVKLFHANALEHAEQGRLDDAVRELERAVALDPEAAEVAAELRSLQQRRGRGGLFSKFFGR